VRQTFAIFVGLVAAHGIASAGVRAGSFAQGVAPALATESAALFVGVREFPEDESLAVVQYAVDDAVDLAYVMAIERQPPLVDPSRVVLALSGEPQKEESRRNLEILRSAKADVRSASQTEILKLLSAQAAKVGKNGLLVVTFATHGVNEDGTQHLLASDSLLRHPETSVTETKIREIVAAARVPRALILVDACRERLTKDARATTSSRSGVAAGLLHDLGRVSGQVVFSAAAPDQYAYDDDARRNGVFTAAVIDALRCSAATDEQGFVTVETLNRFVEERVLSWIQKHRDPEARRATQISAEGRSASMPLSVCGGK
jgi:Caspase domain